MSKKQFSDQSSNLRGSLKRYANPARIEQEQDAWQSIVEDSFDTKQLIGITVMPIAQLLPYVVALSHADKFQLVQFVLAQLAQEDGVSLGSPPAVPFDPRNFFGVAHQSRQTIDDYLADTREGWL